MAPSRATASNILKSAVSMLPTYHYFRLAESRMIVFKNETADLQMKKKRQTDFYPDAA
jgi:hypothetical protein